MDEKTRLLQQVADLTLENRRLKELLAKNGIGVDSPLTSSVYTKCVQTTITTEQLRLFASMFRGRTDVYSLRSGRPNPKTGKCGYYAQIDYNSQERRYLPLTYQILLNHLNGKKEDCSDVVGIYPMLQDEKCFFAVLDFDDHTTENSANIKTEVAALREICEEHGIGHLVERSRSGKGYHIWFFFDEATPAYLAREFCTALLIKASESINYSDFRTFDRIIPTSDHLPTNRKTGKPGIGNMVALPLQGKAVKQDNSVFVDEYWSPYNDQWRVLKETPKLQRELLEQKIAEWGSIKSVFVEDDAPWEPKNASFHQEDVNGAIQITISDRVYVNKNNIRPHLQNQIRRLAAFSNPDFYRKQAMGFSVFGTPRIVYAGEDISHFICLPRGLLETLITNLEEAKIEYKIVDKRNKGNEIKVEFIGNLYPEQERAARKMLDYDNGVLSAATAFGKTVLGAYLISKRRVNTLILVHNYEIMKNWQHDLNEFLKINHDIPVKFTPKGRKKKLTSIIGTLKATSDTTTGIIDIAMISSLGKPGAVNNIVKNYGMVIMDECHHGAARIADGVLREVNAKYFYGLTATPNRNDGLGRKIFMLIGPLRHKYTAKDRADKTHFDYILRSIDTEFSTDKKEIYEIYSELINDDTRNRQIISNAIELIQDGKTPIIITRFRSHAEYLYQQIRKCMPNVFLLLGGERGRQAMESINTVPDCDQLILVATGQYIGEGFNLPRLDTLIMAVPVSSKSIVEQYAGRINRDYCKKKEVIIVDYVDSRVPVLKRMYDKRKATYHAIGYRVE